MTMMFVVDIVVAVVVDAIVDVDGDNITMASVAAEDFEFCISQNLNMLF